MSFFIRYFILFDNNISLLINCINSIYKISYLGFKIEVIIIDNASFDNTHNSLLKISSFFPLKILCNPANFGFAAACNQGARISNSKYIVFLNNDTEVTTGWIQSLIRCASSDFKVGIVGCKLLYPDYTVQHAGVVFSQYNVHHIYRNFHPNHPAVNKYRQFQAVTAACMLVSRKLFIQMGGFDESFINGFEDLDFCFRVRSQGLKVMYNPESVVIHHESKTPGRHDNHNHNATLFSSRWVTSIVQDLDSIYAEDGLRRLVTYENKFGGIWFEDSNPNPFWTKAKLLAANGKNSEAEIAYRLALNFNPYDIRRLTITEELGDLYVRMNRTIDAASCYKAILQIHDSYRLHNKIALTEQ